jgi:integrase/recombinase XerD
MTLLRQRMIEDMRIRGLATTTQRSYIHYVAEFAKHFHRSPDQLDLEAVRQYQLFLSQERQLSPQSINTFVSAVQFLYLTTLEMPWKKEDFPRPRIPETLPVVLAPEEVQNFFEHVNGLPYRVVLLACYGSGLRISEAVALQVSDVDSQRMLLRVQQGKGAKGSLRHAVSRLAVPSPGLLPDRAPRRPLALSFLGSGAASHRRRRADRVP